MKTVSLIVIIYLLQYAHSEPVSEPDPLKISEIPFVSTPCDDITSISTVAYNKKNPEGVKNVKEKDTCGYIANNKEKIAFVTHGFTSSPNANYIHELASQLAQDDYTVFSVNWSQGSCDKTLSYLLYWPAYAKASKNTRKAGEFLANYIQHITETCKVPLNNIVLIGHSLGAHVSGFAAKIVKSRKIGTVSRIFGADPAGPNFASESCDKRLCNTDAERVIALHTTTLLGINEPIGHLNLYFNDGSKQPGCEDDIASACSHANAIRYLTVMYAFDRSKCVFPGVPQLKKFDKKMRPNGSTTNCIVVDRAVFNQNKISPGSYTLFVNEKPQIFCSQNTFPRCQQ
ncbi:phospholipase A1 2-like [Pseudomyrmex gracilis]|uniref:phospholipase A1 2-like n=1 Tax=Pseudomyrmex gracilis TaxID=219809 RepID=UPI0009948ED8|nr:phospholipase A1 2-like [Pseudomyrmex gracilis]